MQIITLTFEELMLFDAASNDKVSRFCTTNTSFAITRQTKLLAIANAYRDINRYALTIGNTSLPLAFGARIFDNLA